MKILHAIVKGEGDPLLILHGFLGMADNWKTLGNKFSENGFQVHLIDQRNHGRSFQTAAFSYTLMAEDLLRYIEFHQLDKVNIIGHSMGGKTAMFFASAYPERVAKLVVVDIAPKYYPQHHHQILSGLNALDFSRVKSRGEADKALAAYVPELSTRQFLLKNLYWTSGKTLAFRFHLESLTQNIEALGEALPQQANTAGATLFLKGGDSQYITQQDTSHIKTHFPNAVTDEIEGAGHWVHAAQPNAFFERVMAFLRPNIL